MAGGVDRALDKLEKYGRAATKGYESPWQWAYDAADVVQLFKPASAAMQYLEQYTPGYRDFVSQRDELSDLYVGNEALSRAYEMGKEGVRHLGEWTMPGAEDAYYQGLDEAFEGDVDYLAGASPLGRLEGRAFAQRGKGYESAIEGGLFTEGMRGGYEDYLSELLMGQGVESDRASAAAAVEAQAVESGDLGQFVVKGKPAKVGALDMRKVAEIARSGGGARALADYYRSVGVQQPSTPDSFDMRKLADYARFGIQSDQEYADLLQSRADAAMYKVAPSWYLRGRKYGFKTEGQVYDGDADEVGFPEDTVVGPVSGRRFNG